MSMSAALRSNQSLTPQLQNRFHTTSSSTLTMATRTLPTPPPEGPGATHTGASHAAPPTTGAQEAAPPTNPPPAQPQQAPIYTIYREAFPVFASKAIDKDWSGLATLAELHDLRVRPRDLIPPVTYLLISFDGIYRQSMTVTCRGCCSQPRSYYRT